jgi:hypothetical protein
MIVHSCVETRAFQNDLNHTYQVQWLRCLERFWFMKLKDGEEEIEFVWLDGSGDVCSRCMELWT